MKRVLVVAGIVVAALGALGVRVVIEGRDALAEGDAAMSARRTADAIAAWETAARWYLPGVPHVDAAYTRLAAVAHGDPQHALAAWRAIRGAALATRSMWTPHADDLAAANAAIATLSAADPEGAGAAGTTAREREAFYATRLAETGRASGAARVVAILGILSWLAGIGVVIRRGTDAAGGVARRPALVGAALAVAGVLGWAVGLYNA